MCPYYEMFCGLGMDALPRKENMRVVLGGYEIVERILIINLKNVKISKKYDH